MSKLVSMDQIIDQGAKDLGYDPDILKKIVLHQFEYIKEFQKNPTSARLHLYKFGMFVIPRWKFYDVVINMVIPALRKYPSEEMVLILRKFLDLRHVLNRYYFYQEYKNKKKDGRYEKTTTKTRDSNNDRDISREGTVIDNERTD